MFYKNSVHLFIILWINYITNIGDCKDFLFIEWNGKPSEGLEQRSCLKQR